MIRCYYCRAHVASYRLPYPRNSAPSWGVTNVR